MSHGHVTLTLTRTAAADGSPSSSGLTCAFLGVEVVAGFLTGSLSLLADAGHMLTDVAGLVLALAAMKLAERPPSPRRTYGYHRAEILAALTNGLVLLAVAAYILAEAWERFRSPQPVASVPVLAVAAVGLVGQPRGRLSSSTPARAPASTCAGRTTRSWPTPSPRSA